MPASDIAYNGEIYRPIPGRQNHAVSRSGHVISRHNPRRPWSAIGISGFLTVQAKTGSNARTSVKISQIVACTWGECYTEPRFTAGYAAQYGGADARTCLKCGKLFPSTGPGNRRCVQCSDVLQRNNIRDRRVKLWA